MRTPARTAAVAAAVALLAASVYAAAPAAADEPLRAHAAARGKFIGFAAATGPLANEAAYRTIAATEFNQVTAENAMKWDATEPSDNSWNFSGADQVVAFAQQNGQQVHGHTLVWHSQTPSWVQGLGAAAMRTAMQDHIATLVGRYASNPAVVSWDVVNEAFNEDGSLRSSFWLSALGPSYIADAFRYARAADPDARLCINDYNVEGVNAKSTAMYDLVRSLRSQGVPVDCVGFQGHLAIQYGFPSSLRQNLERFAALGVQVRITELDVRMQLPRTAAKDATQASYYRQTVEACLAVPACAGVTIWGFTDRYSWVPDTFSGEGAALIYDESYTPKPAYAAVHDALGPVGPSPSPSSSPSASPTASPSASPSAPAGACRVAYTISPWGGAPGFTAGVVVTNTGSAPVSGWTLAFTLPAGQRITPPGWSATWSQSGQAVTAAPLSWNGTLPPGGSTTIGFNGSHTGDTSEPAAFTLGGRPCTVA
jgi:endo-1,4-beta-xylanase